MKAHTRWRRDPWPYCPVCKAGDAEVVGGSIVVVACRACGWPDWDRPAGMSDAEFGFRRLLHAAWQTGPAAYLDLLPVFADWLGDRGDPEEHAARSPWAFESRQRWKSSARKYREAWVVVPPRPVPFREQSPPGAPDKVHNGRWFLGWPPGYVHHLGGSGDRLVFSVMAGRSCLSSEPVEFRIPGGYAALFAPRPADLLAGV